MPAISRTYPKVPDATSTGFLSASLPSSTCKSTTDLLPDASAPAERSGVVHFTRFGHHLRHFRPARPSASGVVDDGVRSEGGFENAADQTPIAGRVLHCLG